jgi:hypothetical protein
MALPSTFGSFWFDPTNRYGTMYHGTGSFGQSPAGVLYYNKTPSTLYNRYTLPFSGGNDPFSQFVRSRQAMFENGYEAALGTNPNLTVQQYAQQIGLNQQNLRNQFMQLAPSQRGVDYSNYGGRVRWIP